MAALLVVSFVVIPTGGIAAPGQAPGATCGAIVPGEAAAFTFLRHYLNSDGARNGYGERFADDVRPILELLERWERSCSAVDQRTAVQSLRKSLDNTRVKGERLYLEALLATALSRGPEVRVAGSRGGLFVTARRGSNAEREARELFDRILDEWPEPALAREYAALGLVTRDEKTLKSSDVALQRMVDHGWATDEIRALHALIAAARKDGSRAGALAGAVTAPSAVAQRITGIAMLLDPARGDEGAGIYLSGLTNARGDELIPYYEDLWPLLDDSERAAYDSLPERDRPDWLRTQWEWRASQASRTVSERLAIHFERALEAMRRYPRVGFRGSPDTASLVFSDRGALPFDDRGILFLRHGEPDDVMYSVPIATDPRSAAPERRIAWYFDHLDTRLGGGLFEFMLTRDRPDWIAAPPIGCPQNPKVRERVVDWMTTLATHDPQLGLIGMNCFSGNSMGMNVMRIRGIVFARRRDFGAATRTEFAAPKFDRLYRGALTSYAFRRPDGSTELIAVLMMPAAAATPEQSAAGFRYQFGATLSIEHTATRRVERIDTVLSLALPQRPSRDQAMRFVISTRATPDVEAVLRLTVVNQLASAEGQVFLSTRDVPSFARDSLQLSDIVLAQPGDGALLTRGLARLDPLPGHQLLENGSFRLFYEVYGLSRETPARIRVVIAPVLEDGLLARLRNAVTQRAAMDLSFQDVLAPGPNGVAHVAQGVTAALDPGRYQVRVQVETAEGTASRITELNVIR